MLELEVPSCGILNVGFGGKTITPLESDAELCFVSGEIQEGSVTQANNDSWVTGGTVYLLDDQGRRGTLVYASANLEERTVFWIFSVPSEYYAIQLQMADQSFELP